MERDPDMNFCGAGEGINIQPDGNVCPCIAFPMRAGNARTDNLKDIYNSVTFNNIRNLKYRDSDRCGKESYCKWCNRCIGQSYIATGNAANASEDNCFIARLREGISLEKREKQWFPYYVHCIVSFIKQLYYEIHICEGQQESDNGLLPKVYWRNLRYYVSPVIVPSVADYVIIYA